MLHAYSTTCQNPPLSNPTRRIEPFDFCIQLAMLVRDIPHALDISFCEGKNVKRILVGQGGGCTLVEVSRQGGRSDDGDRGGTGETDGRARLVGQGDRYGINRDVVSGDVHQSEAEGGE